MLTLDPVWTIMLTQPLQLCEQIMSEKVLEAWTGFAITVSSLSTGPCLTLPA